MAEAMADLAWSDPRVPMASNASGGLVTTGTEVREALIAQIASPVRWVECAHALAGAGASSTSSPDQGRVSAGSSGRRSEWRQMSSADSPKRLEAFLESQAAAT